MSKLACGFPHKSSARMLDIVETKPDGTKLVPSLRFELGGQSMRAVAAGPWTVRHFAKIHAAIGRLSFPRRAARPQAAEVDIAGVTELDTAGAWLLGHLRRQLAASGVKAYLAGATEAQLSLLNVVETNTVTEGRGKRPRAALVPLVGEALKATVDAVADGLRLTAFLGEVTKAGIRTAMRPWRFRWVSFIHHVEHTGLRAVPIISLICLLIGAVVTQQGILQLQQFGAEPMAVDMVGILALREVGILLTAIVVAGRSASAFTAEIGTMKTREEIDAMRTLGIDPIEVLVLPRIAALVITLPILAFIGDLMCLLGGAIMAFVYLDIGMSAFLERVHDAINVRHFMVGLVKAPLAAIIIGLIGCLEGLSVEGSAESLGMHVTISVVKAIFVVIVFDAMFAMFLSASGF
jgi:phospholipid/cholesterol/gamma-HCH transport system permease protein